MSLQLLTLELEGITAGDYLAWCQDPDPPALGSALRSICVDADPLGDTVTALLDWKQTAPTPPIAASAAGLALPTGIRIHASLPREVPHPGPPFHAEAGAQLTCAPAAIEQLLMEVGATEMHAEQRSAPEFDRAVSVLPTACALSTPCA